MDARARDHFSSTGSVVSERKLPPSISLNSTSALSSNILNEDAGILAVLKHFLKFDDRTFLFNVRK